MAVMHWECMCEAKDVEFVLDGRSTSVPGDEKEVDERKIEGGRTTSNNYIKRIRILR